MNNTHHTRFIAAFAVLFFALTLHAAKPSDKILYTVKSGDTVSNLAERYLGGRARWGAIERVNPGLDIHRLRPGQTLYLPENRIQTVGKTAKVLKVNGRAQSAGGELQEGQQLGAGSVINVGLESFVTLQLEDGSILVVEPNTQARIDELRLLSTGAQRATVHIERGRVNIKAAPQHEPGARFEISTPSATTAVRGTQFRVGKTENGVTFTEVTEGRVNVAVPNVGKSVIVPAGSGTIIAHGQAPSAPEPLLLPPDLSHLPKQFAQTIVEISFPPVTSAAAYRVTVARDAMFDDVVASTESASPQIKVAGLPDGTYHLRARAVSDKGLHGLEATKDFVLHARPEPPFASFPVQHTKVAAGRTLLSWSVPENAVSYEINITQDGHSLPRIERHPDASYPLNIVPGTYRWQLATRDTQDRLGPFSEWNTFTAVEPPSSPSAQAALATNHQALTLAWDGMPDHFYQWQMATDSNFSNMLQQGNTAVSSIELPMPDPGTYFVRMRATTNDGVEGPYSSAQKVVVPERDNGFPAWVLLVFLPFLL